MNAISDMPYRWRYWYRLHYVSPGGVEHVTRAYHIVNRRIALLNRDYWEYTQGIACWIEWLDAKAPAEASP